MLCSGYGTSQDETPSTYNICDRVYDIPFVGFSKGLGACSMSNFKFDPNEFKGAAAYTDIKDKLVEKCKAAGFFLTSTKHCYKKPIRSGTRLAYLHLVCEHNKPSIEELSIEIQEEFSSAPPNTRRTTRPLLAKDRCPFHIRIFCNKKDECWYLLASHVPSCIPQACAHRGHPPLPPESVRTVITNLDEDALELALQCSLLSLDNSVIAQLMNVRSSGTDRFTSSQIRYAITRHKADNLVKNFGNKISSAEALLNDFEELIGKGEDLDYVAMVHHGDEGFRIKLPKGRPPKKIGNPDQENIKSIRKNMGLNDGQEVLLAFAWISGEERKMLSKFPELVTFDVTEKTNKEKRGMFVGTGQDGTGRIFIALHSFMPNAQMTSFNWIYKHAVPALWTNDVVTNTEVAITDGEYALYGPLQNLSETDSAWSGVTVFR